MTAIDDYKAILAELVDEAYYAKWRSQNRGETGRFDPYRDALLAGDTPAPPTMTSAYGRRLIREGVQFAHHRALEQSAPTPDPTPAPTPTPTPTPSTRIYTADFESGDFREIVNQQESSPERITIVQSPIIDGKYCVRVACGSQDVGQFGAGGNDRTEDYVQGFSGHIGGGSLEGREVWVAWKMMLELGFPVPSGWAVLTQFHSGWGSPVFAVTLDHLDRLEVEQRGGDYAGNQQGANYKAAILQDKAVRGRAYEVKVQKIWSTGPSGITRVWVDGVKKAEFFGPNLEVGQEASPYMKCGVYGGQWTGDAIAYHDHIRWATSEAGL